MRHFLLIAIAGLILASCAEGENFQDWNFGQTAQGNAPAEVAPMRPNTDFDERLATITQKLETNQSVWQSGPDMKSPEGSSVTKAVLPGAVNKIALVVPLSGPQAQLGQSMLTAAQMALQDMKSNNVTLLPRDSGPTADSARAAVTDAMNEGATLILGPVFADQVKAAARETSGRRVPLIGFTTDWSAANDDTFVMGFLPQEQVRAAMDFARTRGVTSVVVIAPDTPYGRAVVQTAQAHKSLAPHVIMAQQGESPDMLAARVRTLAPDPKTAILFAYDGPNTRRLVTSLGKAGVTAPSYTFLGTGLLDDPTMGGAKELQNVYFASAPLTQRDAFEARYRTLSGKNPVRLATLAYDATALAAVIARDGANTGMTGFAPQAIRDPSGFAGIDGIFRFNANGLISRGLSILTWENGRLREIKSAPQSF